MCIVFGAFLLTNCSMNLGNLVKTPVIVLAAKQANNIKKKKHKRK